MISRFLAVVKRQMPKQVTEFQTLIGFKQHKLNASISITHLPQNKPDLRGSERQRAVDWRRRLRQAVIVAVKRLHILARSVPDTAQERVQHQRLESRFRYICWFICILEDLHFFYFGSERRLNVFTIIQQNINNETENKTQLVENSSNFFLLVIIYTQKDVI